MFMAVSAPTIPTKVLPLPTSPMSYPLMTWSLAQSGTSSYLDEKWVVLYNGIQRSNDVIRTMRLSTTISPADTVEYEAEARFLRGYYHFEGKKIFNNFPYVNEFIQYSAGNLDVPNYASGSYINIWPEIEADLTYAANNLPGTQPNIGRVNKWAAMAFLAKAYMYQHQYDSALTLLTAVSSPMGTTANGYTVFTRTQL